MNKITALILTYYEQRVENVRQIIKDLNGGSRVPDKIIVFSNNPNIKIESVPTIVSSDNYSTRAKYVACLLEPSDFYLLLDDDITVGKDTLKHLEEISMGRKDFCTSNEGVLLEGRPFHQRTSIFEDKIEKPTPTDTLIGSMVFCSFGALLKMLQAEVKIRLKDKKYLFEGDDILMGLANRPITIYPAEKKERCISMDERNINFNKVYGNYAEMRDIFTEKVLREL
jgi:hypothetical protein